MGGGSSKWLKDFDITKPVDSAYTEKVFAEFDTDHNGYLDKEEAMEFVKKWCTHHGVVGANQHGIRFQEFWERFAVDGSITKASLWGTSTARPASGASLTGAGHRSQPSTSAVASPQPPPSRESVQSHASQHSVVRESSLGPVTSSCVTIAPAGNSGGSYSTSFFPDMYQAAEPSPKISLYIKTLLVRTPDSPATSQVLFQTVDTKSPVKDLMMIIVEAFGVPLDQQTLICEGTLLEPDKLVESYGLRDGDVLMLGNKVPFVKEINSVSQVKHHLDNGGSLGGDKEAGCLVWSDRKREHYHIYWDPLQNIWCAKAQPGLTREEREAARARVAQAPRAVPVAWLGQNGHQRNPTVTIGAAFSCSPYPNQPNPNPATGAYSGPYQTPSVVPSGPSSSANLGMYPSSIQAPVVVSHVAGSNPLGLAGGTHSAGIGPGSGNGSQAVGPQPAPATNPVGPGVAASGTAAVGPDRPVVSVVASSVEKPLGVTATAGATASGATTAAKNATLSPGYTPPSRIQEDIHWRRGVEIGSGTFGKVYQAQNVRTGELMAVKQVKFKADSEEQKAQVAQLHREIGAMTDLSHPNIVQLISSELKADKINILMEYVPGASLAAQLKQFGPFEEAHAKRYTKQLLDALNYCHAAGFVHRDIKGANILVSLQGNPKLADFGSAKKFQSVNEFAHLSQGYCYTIEWTAPEVFSHGAYNSKVDIWSVGCVVIEMITGKLPWAEQKFSSRERAMFFIGSTNETPAIPQKLSPSGQDFLKQCLQRDPVKRPSAEQLLQHEWILST